MGGRGQASEDDAYEYEAKLVSAVFGAWAAVLVDLAAPQLGERVLDVACGTGAVSRLVAERVGADGTVVGLDLSPEMLTTARSLPPPPGAAVLWQEGSAAALPFPDRTFDLVVCQQGLQFFPNRPGARREMRRVLAPGGRLALSVWRSVEHSPAHALLEQGLRRRLGPDAVLN